MLRNRIILILIIIMVSSMGCRSTPMTSTEMLEVPPDILSSSAKEAATSAPDKPLPESKTEDSKAEANDGKNAGSSQQRGVYLRIRENLDSTWHDTDMALAQQSGFNVNADKNTWTFTVDYPHTNREAEPGLLERLLLGRKRSEDYRYQVKLTKVENKVTELSVLNHKGEWEDTPEARDILERIKTVLNNN